MAAICQPGSMKDGVRDPRVNVPLCVQEIITVACYMLKHQQQSWISSLQPEFIFLNRVNNVGLQQGLKKLMAMKLHLQMTQSGISLIVTKRTTSSDLIKEHFKQIWGFNGVPCS